MSNQTEIAIEETAEERFIRLGESRVNKTLNDLRLVGALASPTYKFTERQVDEMEQVLLEMLLHEMERLRSRLQSATPEPVFKFGQTIINNPLI